MLDVIVSFDTEDYVTPAAWDAQLWWATRLRERGIRGSFQCVAELIRTLKREGRDDVIDALARHEIGYHTDRHSMPPTLVPGTAGLSLEDGIAWVLRTEARGFAELVETFGRVPVSFCAPGDVWSPAAIMAMAMLGVKVWASPTMFPPPAGLGWALGLLGYTYDVSMDFYASDTREVDRLKRAFDTAADESVRKHAQPTVCIWAHPTTLVTTAFWDVPLSRGKVVAREALPPAPLRDRSDVAAIKGAIEGFLDWLVAREDVRFIDQAALYARCVAAEPPRDLPALLRAKGLKPGEEHRLADPGGSGSADELGIGEHSRWPMLPTDLDWSNLKAQAATLAWTKRAVGV